MIAIQQRVIYGDTDQMAVVYYGNYLRYFEAARNEFIRAKGLRYRDFEERYGLLAGKARRLPPELLAALSAGEAMAEG